MDTTPHIESSQEKLLHPQQAFIDGLREMADWLEANPKAPFIREQTINVCVRREEFAEAAWLTGNSTVFQRDQFTVLRRTFGPLSLDVFGRTEDICGRVEISDEPEIDDTVLATRAAGGVA